MKKSEKSTSSSDTDQEWCEVGFEIYINDGVYTVPVSGLYEIGPNYIQLISKTKPCDFCEVHCGNEWCVTKDQDDNN